MSVTTKEKFNASISNFIDDLLKISPEDQDLRRMSHLTSISKIEKDLFIKNFQAYFLREVFVRAILKKDVDFFITFDFSADDTLKKMKDDINYEIFIKIKSALCKIKGTEHQETIFKWFTVLIYYAYVDLNLNPSDIFKQILSS